MVAQHHVQSGFEYLWDLDNVSVQLAAVFDRSHIIIVTFLI